MENWDLPSPKPLPNWPAGGVFQHVFVGDEAFPIKANLIRPYPRARVGIMERIKQIFNYRLSRARIVENAFGILAQRFRLFNRRISLCPMNVDNVIKVCCILHNYLTEDKDTATIHNRLNLDQEPYLQDDEAILDLDNLNGYRSAAAVHALVGPLLHLLQQARRMCQLARKGCPMNMKNPIKLVIVQSKQKNCQIQPMESA